MVAQNYQLVVRYGAVPGKVYPILKPKIAIGRDTVSDILINEIDVSRHHAAITQSYEGYLLEDLGSTNGTSVNGEKLSEPYFLQPGDVIRVGEKVSLTFEVTPVFDPNATVLNPVQVVPPANFINSVPDVKLPEPFLPESSPLPAYIPATQEEPAARPDSHIPVERGMAGLSGELFEDSPKKKDNRTWWIIGILALLVVLCACMLFFWWVDSNYLWCPFFPFLPGCPA